MKPNTAEAAAYFQAKKGYDALFQLFRKKYESLGRIGGSVDISRFTPEEIEEFSAFMSVSPHHLLRKEKIQLVDFEKRLWETRFGDMSLHRLLEVYFGEKIQSKKERKEHWMIAQQHVINNLKEQCPELTRWFEYLEGRTKDTNWIWRIILEPDIKIEIKTLHKAFLSLPSSLERYPLFSQRITGNPHAFDLTTTRGKMWIHLLHIMSGKEGPPPTQTELVNDLLLSVNLLRDDVANFVTAANLLAYQNGAVHPVWQAALQSKTVLNVPLRELLKAEDVRATLNEKSVFVVENSGVFSALVDAVPDAPLICTHGQFKLAGLKLMDMLVKSGAVLYYSGDFDPEGLAMALRFHERYGEKGRLWRMTAASYQLSQPVVELRDRKRKLAGLKDTVLHNLACEIEQNGNAGYQEGILHLLIKDLKAMKRRNHS
ncbi:TIGR02679 family protein [Bacillus swezeyi]|uniref:TIGR02679 family protein n=1 Tax=Bacillus swezeyi TaxID=1925020 RepID=UPI0039C70EBD